MNAQRMTMSIAGMFIIISLAMGHFNGQFDLTIMSWLWFIAFVGLNLFQSGITGFCPLTRILKTVGAR